MKKYVNLLYKIGIAITAIQTFIIATPLPFDAHTSTIITGLIGILSGLVTTLYQRFHKKIPNKIAYTGLVIIVVAVLGALNDLFKIIPLDDKYAHIVTYMISITSFALQLIFKQVYQPKKNV